MRIASFNVENMFRRPVALNQETWDEGKPVLEAYAALQELLENEIYSAADKERIVDLMGELGLSRKDDSKWVVLRRNRGQLVSRKRDRTIEVTAAGRGDWIGWLELKREAVDELATRNTARVVAELAADVLGVIEAEDRPALQRFNRDVLPSGFTSGAAQWAYEHVMLVDGNDDRGIDVGVLTREDYPILQMRSHVDDRDSDGNYVFSRDCPEYEIPVGDDKPLLVMVNHFKSKGYGSQADSNAKRQEQAQRVKEIYEARRADRWDWVAILGDFNDTPDSPPLAPLLENTDLRDASDHDGFDDGGRPGTFATSKDKIDYVLLSPAMFERMRAGGIFRKGVWHGPRVQNPWPMLDTIERPEQAASDHAAVWADLDL